MDKPRIFPKSLKYRGQISKCVNQAKFLSAYFLKPGTVLALIIVAPELVEPMVNTTFLHLAQASK